MDSEPVEKTFSIAIVNASNSVDKMASLALTKTEGTKIKEEIVSELAELEFKCRQATNPEKMCAIRVNLVHRIMHLWFLWTTEEEI